MLPDYPSLKERLLSSMMMAARAKVTGEGYFFASLPRQRQFEGRDSVVIREDGTEDAVSFKQTKATLEMKFADVGTINVKEWQNIFVQAAREMVKQEDLAAIESISEAVEAVGNSFDVGGQPFSIDHLITALDKMFISFHPDGTPDFPVIVGGTKVTDIVSKVLNGLKTDPASNSKFEAMIQKKREQWLDREASRKLVG